jgi:hypothetical protein
MRDTTAMDSIVVLLAMLAGGAVLAGILAFVVLSAVASLLEILPRPAGRADGQDCAGRAAGTASLHGARRTV